MKKLTFLLSGTAAFAAIEAAQAQTPTNVVSLPPVVVVSPTTVPTPAREIASSVTVITAADLERDQRRTVPDALQTVPGLNVVQTGGPGGQTAIFMRGTNANHVKVLIDGIDAGNPSTPNGAFDFGNLLAGDIERIEILRGPQSGLYGSDAIGGVISITTKRGSGPPTVSATVEAGSFQQFNQNFHSSGAIGNFNYSFNALHLRAVTPVTPLNLLPPGGRRNDDRYDNWTYSTKLGADLSENFAVSYVARYTDAKNGFTGDDFSVFPSVPEALQSTLTNRNFFTRGEAVWSLFDGRFKNFFGVSYSDQNGRTVNPNPDFASGLGLVSPQVAPPVTNIGNRTKYDWRGEAAFAPGQVLVLGLEHQKDALTTDSTGVIDAGFTTFTQTLTKADKRNDAGYIELQSQIANRFFVVANVRADDDESFGRYTTWRVAPAFIVPGTETKLKATYGTGFKAPTLTQLFVDNPSFGFVANPNLVPETSKGYDFGFEQQLWRDRLGFGATYFHNDIRNLIVNQFVPVFTNVNIGEASMHGVESFVSIVPVDGLKFRGDYTRTFTENEQTGLGLLRRPGHKASLVAIWNPIHPLSLSATLLYVGTQVDTGRVGAPPRLDAPSYTVVNLAANYEVNRNVTVFGRIDNLFDEQYQQPTGFLRPGFGAFAGIRVTSEVPGLSR